MQREAPRTIESALPPLQKEVSTAEYEIIVIDNGTPDPLVLSDYQNVRLVRIPSPDALSSPVSCINEIVNTRAKGDALLICIDGARMFSPYLIRRTIDVLNAHPEAFTFVGSRHLGTKPQMRSTKEGYDQAAEDRLLGKSNWRTDLDRLYDISVWAGAHRPGQVERQSESNAVGMRRALWNKIGGYNEAFTRPGGGLANLEFFSRYLNHTETLGVLLLGEATFHQVHGGAATSNYGYFSESLEEHKSATGKEYAFPSANFLCDLGIKYERLAKVGHHLKQCPK